MKLELEFGYEFVLTISVEILINIGEYYDLAVLVPYVGRLQWLDVDQYTFAVSALVSLPTNCARFSWVAKYSIIISFNEYEY